MIDAFGMARGLASAWVVMTLCACGALPPAQPPASEDNPVPAAAAASAAAEAVYRLEVEAPGDLRTLLTTYLDLARFQSTAQVDRITPIELNLGPLGKVAPRVSPFIGYRYLGAPTLAQNLTPVVNNATAYPGGGTFTGGGGSVSVSNEAPGLPHTGTDLRTPAVVGGASVLTGSALVVLAHARRRRSASS